MQLERLIEGLNAPAREDRLAALAERARGDPDPGKDGFRQQSYPYHLFIFSVFSDEGGLYGVAERSCHGGNHGS